MARPKKTIEVKKAPANIEKTFPPAPLVCPECDAVCVNGVCPKCGWGRKHG